MEEVVVAVDGSEQSVFKGLRVGHELHQQASLPLRLLSVVDDEGKEQERRREIRYLLPLGEVGNPLVAGSEIEVEVAHDPRAFLAQALGERDGALFCMATRGRGAVGQAVVGSVATSVLREAHRPMILAGPGLPDDWSGPVLRVVVPLDGSEVSERILPYAVELAEELGTELRLLRVIDTEGEDADSGDFQASVEAYLEQVGERLQPELSRSVTWVVLKDRQPARAISDYCAGRGSLVMMSTLGWSGLARLVMGSVAQALVRQAPFPVGVLCPPDTAA